MPTGYTAAVQEGEVTTLSEYAWSCARNFGAAIHMRDERGGAQISLPTVGTYYPDALHGAVEKLRRFDAMTTMECAAERLGTYVDVDQQNERSAAEKKTTRARYSAMLGKIAGWSAPTDDHAGLRKFMVSQLVESIEWDCHTYTAQSPEMAEPIETWRLKRQAKLRADIAWAEKNISEECDRITERRRWFQALARSIGDPPGGFVAE